MANPSYNIGDTVYFKESAALGHVEAAKISGVYSHPNGWMYTINASVGQSTGTYGDRRSLVNNAIMYFNENEFVSYCEALELARTALETQLGSINSRIQSCT